MVKNASCSSCLSQPPCWVGCPVSSADISSGLLGHSYTWQKHTDTHTYLKKTKEINSRIGFNSVSEHFPIKALGVWVLAINVQMNTHRHRYTHSPHPPTHHLQGWNPKLSRKQVQVLKVWITQLFMSYGTRKTIYLAHKTQTLCASKDTGQKVYTALCSSLDMRLGAQFNEVQRWALGNWLSHEAISC